VKEYIEAVGRILWVLTIGSAIIIVAAIPNVKDRQFVRALQELRQFESGFDQKALEKKLFDFATAREQIPLKALASAIRGRNAPVVRVSKGASAIVPRAKIDLNTLGSIYTLSQNDASVRLGVVRADELAAGIEWRLVQRKEDQRYEILSVVVAAGDISEADVDLERRVTSALRTANQAKEASKKALDEATKAE
jgi:hypothetical protein